MQQNISQTSHIDIEIIFVKGENLKNCDFFDKSDPYLIAKVINRQFKSKIVKDNNNPIWNEKWILNQIPNNSVCTIGIQDYDKYTANDDMGTTQFIINGNVPKDEKQHLELEIRLKGKNEGKLSLFYTVINYQISGNCINKEYTQTTSNFHGFLMGIEDEMGNYAYSNYSIELHQIKEIFQEKKNHWNVNYINAQKIFGEGVKCSVVRQCVHTQHANLYNNWFPVKGNLFNANDFFHLLNYGQRNGKTRVFTYIILEPYFRFSEKGANFNFKDFSIKHAVHANAAENVRMAGEFHIHIDQQGNYKLIIDNNSGTFSPSKEHLPLLEKLFKENFHDILVESYDRDDPKLKEYIKADLNHTHTQHTQQVIITSSLIPHQNYNITIVEGKGLGGFDSNGKSDPYVKIRLNGLKIGKESKTNIIKCTINPQWNFVFKNVQLKVNDVLTFTIYDWDFMASNDYMGTCHIVLTEEFISQTHKEVKLSVNDTNYLPNPKYKGEIIVKFDAI